jgi:hypothetical protein
MPRVDVRVTLRSGQAGVTQKFLNGTEIRTALQEMRGKAVPQSVWTDPLSQSGLLNTARNEHPHASVCQSTTV